MNSRKYEYDVFISYARADVEDVDKRTIPNNIVDKVRKLLTNNNISIWIDTENVYGSSNYNELICDGIEKSRIFVPILTEEACNSYYVYDEIGWAKRMGVTIMPLKVASNFPVKIEFQFVNIDYITFNHANPDDSLNQLLNSINKVLASYKQADYVAKKSKEVRDQIDKIEEDIINYQKYIVKLNLEIKTNEEEKSQLEVSINLQKDSLNLIEKDLEAKKQQKESLRATYEDLMKQTKQDNSNDSSEKIKPELGKELDNTNIDDNQQPVDITEDMKLSTRGVVISNMSDLQGIDEAVDINATSIDTIAKDAKSSKQEANTSIDNTEQLRLQQMMKYFDKKL